MFKIIIINKDTVKANICEGTEIIYFNTEDEAQTFIKEHNLYNMFPPDYRVKVVEVTVKASV